MPQLHPMPLPDTTQTQFPSLIMSLIWDCQSVDMESDQLQSCAYSTLTSLVVMFSTTRPVVYSGTPEVAVVVQHLLFLYPHQLV